MRGVCINAGGSATLNENEHYFLFEHGPNNFYVSRFDNVTAHFGSYRREYFQLTEAEQGEIEKEKLFVDGLRVAEIKRPYKGYGFDVGDVFVIGPTELDQGTHFYYYDPNDLRFRGCMPVSLFKILAPYEGQKTTIPVKHTETAQIEVENAVQRNTLENNSSGKTRRNGHPDSVQMDIFDFILEGQQ